MSSETLSPNPQPSTTVSAAAEFNQQIGGTDRLEAAKAIQAMVLAVQSLREIRDKRLFTEGGFPTFRSWCMSHFGERLGGLLHDNL